MKIMVLRDTIRSARRSDRGRVNANEEVAYTGFRKTDVESFLYQFCSRREVRIRIAASGINPGDIKKRQDSFGYGMPYPRVIPRNDGAGQVDRVGDGVSPEWVGRRVWVLRRTAVSGRPVRPQSSQWSRWIMWLPYPRLICPECSTVSIARSGACKTQWRMWVGSSDSAEYRPPARRHSND
jgi:hypothetical protein